jgi:hypothetical protein
MPILLALVGRGVGLAALVAEQHESREDGDRGDEHDDDANVHHTRTFRILRGGRAKAHDTLGKRG